MQPPYDGGPPTQQFGPPPEQPGRPLFKRRWVRVTTVSAAAFVVAAVAVGVASSGSKPAARPSAAPTVSATPLTTDPGGYACEPYLVDQNGYCPADAPTPTPSPSTEDLTGPLTSVFTITDQQAGTSYEVSALRVLEPATGSDEFETPNAGNHFAGVKFKITGDSGYSHDDANIDALAEGSDGQVYTPDFDSIAAGTNFNSGEFNVTSGHSQTGWVTFQLPRGVTVTAVQWQPNSGLSDQQPATWTVGNG